MTHIFSFLRCKTNITATANAIRIRISTTDILTTTGEVLVKFPAKLPVGVSVVTAVMLDNIYIDR